MGFTQQYGTAPLDFSVNTNPLGFSPKARAALHSAADRACEYPDPLYRKLRAAIAAHEDLPSEWILCGNGAADLIWRIAFALRPRQGLVTAPTFSEYAAALDFVGCQVSHHCLRPEDDFCLTETILPQITEQTDILFLCNPNNPTGLTVQPELLLRILERCHACGTMLVVDECFLGFLPEHHRLTLKSQLSDYPNLLILKAFTKLYGMAGLRLGYGLCANTTLLSRLEGAGQCWPVSIAAEVTGIAALQDDAFVARTLAFLPEERARVREAMLRLGLTVYPGQANYLFFYTPIPHYEHLLARQGILIRSCANYMGLASGYYRIAILTPEKNDRLLAAMAQIRRENP